MTSLWEVFFKKMFLNKLILVTYLSIKAKMLFQNTSGWIS